jgi:hypothetical protein
MAKRVFSDMIESIILILLILFGIFIIYQVYRILFGGSWNPEDVIIALLIFTLGLTVVVLRKSDSNAHKLMNISRSFNSLAEDFKGHMHEFHYKKK